MKILSRLFICKFSKSLLHAAPKPFTGLALCAALFLIVGCSGSSSPVVKKKDVLAVSIEPERWLLEQIVGDKMEVTTLMANGGNPESYEPTFSHLANIRDSRAFFQVGNLGFETAIIEKVKATNPDLPVFCISDSIKLIVNNESHANHRHTHGAIDPHVWTSVSNAKIMAANMLRGVIAIDSANAKEYTNNFIALSCRLDSLDSRIAQILEPMKEATFIVWHPSLTYFARDYDLNQLSLGDEGREPSIADVKQLVNRARKSGASVFLLQRDFDRNQADALLGELKGDIAVREFNPLNYDFETELLNIARSISGSNAD